MNRTFTRHLHRGARLLAATLVLWGCSQSPEERHADFVESARQYADQGDYARAVLQFKNALRALPDDPEVHYELGQALLATKNPAEAVQAFLRATELDPKHARAQLHLAELMLAAGKEQLAPEAVKRLEVVLSESPDDSDAHFVMAAAKMRMGSRDEAEEHLRESLRNSPEHLKSAVALATVKLAQKDFRGAEAVMLSAVERAPTAPEPILALGHLYTLMGRDKEAEPQFRKALDLAPNHVPSMLVTAGLYLRQGREPEAGEIYRQVSQIGEEYKSLYAQFLMQQGQGPRAVALLEELYRSDPKDRNIRSRLVAAYLAGDRQSDARRTLDSVLEENPSDVHARLQRGYLNLQEKKVRLAQNDLSEVVRNQPDWPVARFLLARVHLADGAVHLYRHELETALELEPTYLAVRLDLARSLLSEGAVQAALGLLNGMPKEQSSLLPSIVTRNWALMAANDWVEVRRGIDRGMAIERSPELVLQDGIDRLRRGDIKAARSSFTEALNENPGEVRAMAGLAQTYIAQGEPSAALDKFREYASKAPNTPGAQRLLGDYLAKNGDLPGARQAYEAAMSAEPGNSTGVRLKLAELDLAESKFQVARERLTTIVLADGTNSRARLLLGIAEELLENHDAAREHYRRIVEDEPDNVIALNNLAYRLATDTQQLNEALSYAQRAKEAAPDNHSVGDTLGWIYYLKGLYDAALPHLEGAASGLSKQASVQYRLAMVYFKLGDQQRGEEVLRAAQALDSTSAEAAAARDLRREIQR